jgi:hypothetical protein
MKRFNNLGHRGETAEDLLNRLMDLVEEPVLKLKDNGGE